MGEKQRETCSGCISLIASHGAQWLLEEHSQPGGS